MRGYVDPQSGLFCYFSIEERILAEHPPRAIKRQADAVLASMSAAFDAMYAEVGRPSIALERLLKSALEVWPKEHPKLAEWAEEAIPGSLTVFDFPAARRVRLRITNGLEGIHRKLRRRTHCLHVAQHRFLPAFDFGHAR